MSPLRLITSLLFLFVAVSIGYLIGHRDPAAESSTTVESTPPRTGYSIYYFHGNNRCNTCLKLESLSQEAIAGGFMDELADHQLAWGVINFEESVNKHFAKEFDLYSPALIIMENKPVDQRRWHNLAGIWDYTDDKEAYLKYVRSEVGEFINGNR
ncbi:MAG TPA: nitrophenyl compound nitroreductase subunit ArsF family protein [candidate division Zixibacteria bacterium]|nr:nitrophenyl compound nitroreductase subunit ArsF family protein [candidate division Zixibacteria bacterium]